MFVDRAEIFVKAGDGGRGMNSFRREKYVPRGGPNGGDGGKGGSIILLVSEHADNLAELAGRKFWKAEKGEPGGSSHCSGSDGKDFTILVPPGTIVRDRDRGNILKDLTEPGMSVVVAKGGKGGRGNRHFATSTNRTPREFELGGIGEERWLTLELKVIADVGLIGLPNAGKSTMLSRLSRATPEIADYPFTTKYPNLGIVALGNDQAFVMADLPGLIEGASEGIGLGHEFLRHVDRTRILIHLVEPFPTDGSDPLKNYQMIRREIMLYSAVLATKPEIVVVSKSELPESAEVAKRMSEELGQEVPNISAVTGQGLSVMVNRVVQLLKEVKEQEIREKAAAQSDPFKTRQTMQHMEPIALPGVSSNDA
jgi:GTPase